MSSEKENTMYYINRHVLNYLSPDGLLKFGIIDNPDNIVKKKMPKNIIYSLKHYKKYKDVNIFADSSFKYIFMYKLYKYYGKKYHMYMDTNLLYFGYKLEEIDSMTIDEIINELLSR